VKDQGAGIPAEDLDKIFDPYFTTKREGTGLGLAIAYSIMKKHGGHISVSTQAGKGSVFSIYLPASLEEVEREVRVPPAPSARYSGKVLVVDDEEDLRQFLSEILEHSGFTVCAVDDGARAVSAYEQAMSTSTPFDLVITDLTIPGGMGGRETIEKLLEVDPKVKVVVSSGYSNDPIMSDFGSYGFIGVIEKPYDFDTLPYTVSRMLSSP